MMLSDATPAAQPLPQAARLEAGGPLLRRLCSHDLQVCESVSCLRGRHSRMPEGNDSPPGARRLELPGRGGVAGRAAVPPPRPVQNPFNSGSRMDPVWKAIREMAHLSEAGQLELPGREGVAGGAAAQPPQPAQDPTFNSGNRGDPACASIREMAHLPEVCRLVLPGRRGVTALAAPPPQPAAGAEEPRQRVTHRPDGRNRRGQHRRQRCCLRHVQLRGQDNSFVRSYVCVHLTCYHSCDEMIDILATPLLQ